MEILRELNILSVTVRILMALTVGGLLGIGRGRKNRPAGFRTYMLVCVGSALVMMTNMYVFKTFNISDPVRMGAQVISGIGFLGAGTIIVTGRNQIKGITTAAGLWTAACGGLAIGVGFYEGAIIGGVTIFIIMTVMQRVDTFIHVHSKTIDVYIEMEAGNPFSAFLNHARTNGLDVHDVQMNRDMGEDGALAVVLSAESEKRCEHSELIAVLSKAPGVRFIEEL